MSRNLSPARGEANSSSSMVFVEAEKVQRMCTIMPRKVILVKLRNRSKNCKMFNSNTVKLDKDESHELSGSWCLEIVKQK